MRRSLGTNDRSPSVWPLLASPSGGAARAKTLAAAKFARNFFSKIAAMPAARATIVTQTAANAPAGMAPDGAAPEGTVPRSVQPFQEHVGASTILAEAI